MRHFGPSAAGAARAPALGEPHDVRRGVEERAAFRMPFHDLRSVFDDMDEPSRLAGYAVETGSLLQIAVAKQLLEIEDCLLPFQHRAFLPRESEGDELLTARLMHYA